MYCKYCGEPIDDDSKFCKYCGHRLYNIGSSKEIIEPQKVYKQHEI